MVWKRRILNEYWRILRWKMGQLFILNRPNRPKSLIVLGIIGIVATIFVAVRSPTKKDIKKDIGKIVSGSLKNETEKQQEEIKTVIYHVTTMMTMLSVSIDNRFQEVRRWVRRIILLPCALALVLLLLRLSEELGLGSWLPWLSSLSP